MGWDIDDIILNRVMGEILKDRYAGCEYSMASSFSPVIIRHRGKMTIEERQKIVSLFPEFIRIEFQFTEVKSNITQIYGRGDLQNQIIMVISPPGIDSNIIKNALNALGLKGGKSEVNESEGGYSCKQFSHIKEAQ